MRWKGAHEHIEEYRQSLIRQLEVNGVSVHLGPQKDAQMVKSAAPEAPASALTMEDVCLQAAGWFNQWADGQPGRHGKSVAAPGWTQ